MKKKSDDIDYFEMIEDYLDGRMTESDKLLFEKRLTEDNVLAKEFEIRKKLVSLLKGATEYQHTKDHVNQILNKKKYNKFYSTPIIAIAASIIILVGVFFLIKSNKNHDPGLLISETDTTQVLRPKIEKRDPKANIEYYRPFSQVEPGSKVEISPDTLRVHKGTRYSYKLKLEASIQADLRTNNFCFYTDDSILKGKYIYLNDSLIDGELYYKFRSIEKNSINFIIHSDSIKLR
ncbi:MAG: hypothetical protein DRJ05_06775 [Bacteroidetes bacterium]|nr:MAG: hypothetical protein DRJ05_06775 [Bacteroidota bacterium]